MSWISLLRLVKQSKISAVVTVYHTSKPSGGNLNVHFHNNLLVRCSSTLDSHFKNASPKLSYTLQRTASTSGILFAKKSSPDLNITLPDPPKRPLSAYNLFCKDSYEKAKESLSDEEKNSSKLVIANLGKMWKALPENESQMYKLKAKNLSEEYQNEKAAWKASLSPEQEQALSRKKDEHTQIIKNKKLEKVFKETEKPERPKRVQAMNLMDMGDIESGLVGSNAKERFTMYVQRRSEKWNSMPENEKAALKELAHERNENANVNYQKKLAAWVQRMFDENNIKIVAKPEVKSALQQLGMPPKNRSVLQLFLMSDEGRENGATISNAKSVYDKLPKAQREKFSEQAMKDKDRMKQEYEDWMGELKQKGLENYAEALLKKYRARKMPVKKMDTTSKKKKDRSKKKSKKTAEKNQKK